MPATLTVVGRSGEALSVVVVKHEMFALESNYVGNTPEI